MLKEVSQERIEIFGKLKDVELDLSKHEFINKERVEYLINVVLGDSFRENLKYFSK